MFAGAFDMDLKSIRNTVNADKTISVIDRFVIVALAVGMFREGDKYKVSISDLACQCNVSPRTAKKSIANLKRAGIVSVSADGTANVYKLNSAMIPRQEIGARNAPIGAADAPMGGNVGARNAPIGAANAPIGGVYIGLEYKENVCEKSRGRACARAHTHARAFDELTEADAIAAGKAAGVSPDIAREVFEDMKANGGGYMKRGGVFVKVTGDTLQAAIRTMSQHAKPKTQAAATAKPKAHTEQEIKQAQILCAERCAMFKAGKCGAGVAVLPALSAHPHPPQECRHFKEL